MFTNRKEAGRLLSEKLLETHIDLKETVVLGIARGGVIVASIVAWLLHLPLDVVVVRKIGTFDNPELAIGAVGPEKTVYWDKELCQRLGLSSRQKETLAKEKGQEQEEREKLFRNTKKRVDILGKTAILIDDGVATGATVIVARDYLHSQKAKKLILAVPIVAKETKEFLLSYFDEIIALKVSERFHAVGQFYKEFSEVSDKEVLAVLSKRK